MASWHNIRKVQNDVDSRNTNQRTISTLENRNNEQNESAYSFGRDPDSIHTNAKKTNGTNRRNNSESSNSFGVGPDKDSNGYLKFGVYDNGDKNVWPQNAGNMARIPASEIALQETDMSISTRTNHSYAVIMESPAVCHRAIPRQKSNRCRIMKVTLLISVLALLGVVAFFVISNILSKGKSCGDPPSIEHGQVNMTDESNQRKATVFCKSGYGTGENEEITCDEDGNWDSVEPCKLSGCGQLPIIQNGKVTGTDDIFNSSANLSCNNGFMTNNTVSFRCMSNGSWVNDTVAVCIPHPCGPYTLPGNIYVIEDLSHINMSVILQCDDGLDFTENSDNLIKCDNNTWTKNPKCEIEGILTMDSTRSPVQIGDQFHISCLLTNSEKWQTVLLSRSELSNDSTPEFLYSVTNNHANSFTKTQHSAKLFDKEVSTLDDGVRLQLSFTNVQCDDSGVYTCTVLVGDLDSPLDSRTTEKEVKVIETDSEVTQIIAEASHVQGDEVNVSCKGLIGKDEKGNKLGEMYVSIYLNENTKVDINSVIESTRTINCQVEETVKATFVVTNEMNGAELQCIFRGTDESQDKKSILLNVTTTQSEISTSSTRVIIGQSLNISTQLSHIRGWNIIELRKNCSGTELAIFSIQANEAISNITMEDHIILNKVAIDNTTASLEYHFTNVRCSDACWKGGDVTYISAVKIGDIWRKAYATIEFQLNPTVPVLSLGQDRFYMGQEAILICTGGIGIPIHNMEITENDKVKDVHPSESTVALMNETCENVETLTYTFNVKDESNGNIFQCQINLTNGTKLLSNEVVVKVDSPGKSCGDPPSIEHGQVNMTDESNQRKATVFCKSGYGTGENEEITCDEDGNWDSVEPCKLSGCGQLPIIQNGKVTGTDDIFNSSANLSCNNGFMTNNTVSFRCMSNGSWVNDTVAVCIPHPCGPYTLPGNIYVIEDLSHINMSVILQCDDGLDFTENSDNLIKCDNNTWTKNPKCEIEGILTMDSTRSTVQIGDQFHISCLLTNSEKWQTVLLSRSELSNDSTPEFLYSVTNNHANSFTKTQHSAKLFDKEVSTLDDGVRLQLSFTNVQCDDSGVYTCTVLVGDLDSPLDSRTIEKEVKVIETDSEVTQIIAEASHVQGDEVNVSCKGLIGKDEKGNKLGEMYVSIYLNENTKVDINSVIESTRTINCQVEETAKATFVVTNEMNEAELQCIFRGTDESQDKKSILLNVTTTQSEISTSSTRVIIGQSLNISTQLSHIRGWNIIELRKNCSGTELSISSIQANEAISNITMEDHIILNKVAIDNTTASLEYHFTNVRCSDACWKGGDVTYISAVKIGDIWRKAYATIEFQLNPTVPVLSLGQDMFYMGQEAILICTGGIGIPIHNMEITENKVKDVHPSESTVALMNETCENVETLTYTFNVKDESNGNIFQCQINLTNGTKLLSNEVVVKVDSPVLYFTNKSKTGIVGSSKTILCILTEMENVTHVVITRYRTGTKVCEVDVTGNGTCVTSQFSISGTLSGDMTVFTTTLTIHSVACNHEGNYSCKAVGVNEMKTSMYFEVNVSASIPIIQLPKTIVENQISGYEDLLKCEAHLGYPISNRKLKIQIKRNGSNSFEDYISISGEGSCMGRTTIVSRQHEFEANINGSKIRCAIVDGNNEVLNTSIEKDVRMLENICLNKATGEFDPHPYDCSRYIWCVGARLYDIKCAGGSCSLADTDPICNSHDCAKCYT